MSVETAQDLFVQELKDIYSAEKQAVRAYPRVAKVIRSEELKAAVAEHLEQTKNQLERLDRVFEILGARSSGKTCEGMKGLLQEATEQVEEIGKGPVLDAALIGALQRVEHYEIAAYGTVATLAEAMGQNEIHDLLAQTLEEEKETDQRLTGVSQSVNSAALAEAEEGEDEEEEQPSRTATKKRSTKSASKSKGKSRR